MSPEQAEGRVDQLGPTSDVYSLGAMLYTMLSGRAPFEYIWCEVTALLDRVKLGEFPPPRKVNPRVPRALEAVCLKAMATRPEDRYPTASALAEDIERWLADEPVAAYREPMLPRMSRWARQHKPIVAGAAALLVTAVVALSMGVILVGREQSRTEKQRRLAIAKSDEATQKAEMLRRRDAVSRVNLAYREYLDDNVALADDLLAGCPDDLRSWEWPYARRLGHSDLKTWTDSSRGLDVWCVAFAPDGTRIATGTGPWFQVGEDRTGELVVRDIRTGAEVFASRGLAGAVQALAYSPDGRTIAAAHGFAGKGAGLGLDAPRRGHRQTHLARGRDGDPDPEPGLRARRPHDRHRLRTLQRFVDHRLRPTPRREDRRRPRPVDLGSTRRSIEPWRSHPTAASSPWPAARWPTSGTSPDPTRPSPTGFVDMSTSCTRWRSARTVGDWRPPAGTRPSGSGTGRPGGCSTRSSATGASSAAWRSRPTGISSSRAARTRACDAGTWPAAARTPRSTAIPASSTAWRSGRTGPWPHPAAWTAP